MPTLGMAGALQAHRAAWAKAPNQKEQSGNSGPVWLPRKEPRDVRTEKADQSAGSAAEGLDPSKSSFY